MTYQINKSTHKYNISSSNNIIYIYYFLYILLLIYRIAGNFQGVLIFVIFVTIPRVTKFSTHEIFHPRIFNRLLCIGLRETRNLKPRKLILKIRDSFSRKFAPLKITRYTVYHFLYIYIHFLFLQLTLIFGMCSASGGKV